MNELNIETYKQYDQGTNVLEINGQTLSYKSTIPDISVASLVDLQLIAMKINRNCKNISTLDPFVDVTRAQCLDRSNIQDYLFKSSFTKAAKSVIHIALRNLYGLEPSELNTLFTMFYTKAGGGTIEALVDSCKNCAQEKRVKG